MCEKSTEAAEEARDVCGAGYQTAQAEEPEGERVVEDDLCRMEDVKWSDKFICKMTYREFLQHYGTDAVRFGLHPDAWVNALFADYTEEDKWCISDVRFGNETWSIQERGGILIRINRDTDSQDKHESETALDGYEGFDYIVDNNGTIAELKTKLIDILVKEKLM